MRSDAERWDQRWSESAAVTASSAPELLADPSLAGVVLAELSRSDAHDRPGRVLDVASGLGAQSVWFAERGARVIALDVSAVAIDHVRRTAEQVGVDIDARVWDTDDGLPDDATGLAVVLCQRFRAVDLYDELVDRLRPGGVLLLTVLSAVGAPNPPGPFHAPAGELSELIDATSHTVLHCSEGNGVASIAIRRDPTSQSETSQSETGQRATSQK